MSLYKFAQREIDAFNEKVLQRQREDYIRGLMEKERKIEQEYLEKYR